jgi:hypothetical protein
MPRLLPNEQENSVDGLLFGSTYTDIAITAPFMNPHNVKCSECIEYWDTFRTRPLEIVLAISIEWTLSLRWDVLFFCR